MWPTRVSKQVNLQKKGQLSNSDSASYLKQIWAQLSRKELRDPLVEQTEELGEAPRAGTESGPDQVRQEPATRGGGAVLPGEGRESDARLGWIERAANPGWRARGTNSLLTPPSAGGRIGASLGRAAPLRP